MLPLIHREIICRRIARTDGNQIEDKKKSTLPHVSSYII
jgi:hypothetical protein